MTDSSLPEPAQTAGWKAIQNHYLNLLDAFAEGQVVPFLGAGVGLCGRPLDATYQQGRWLPSGSELSSYLARRFYYSEPGPPPDLARVAQYAAVVRGAAPLYRGLRDVFDASYPPTAVHRALARIPRKLREKGAPRPTFLIVTTNYDDALERAFERVREPLDVLWYMADGKARGKFYHAPPQGEPRLIERPNEYTEVDPDRRTVLIKMHGAVDRSSLQRDSYVITEDHYIEYLARADAASLFPAHVARKLSESHLLFLGYSLRDWNLRVILHHIWAQQDLRYGSWAIQRDVNEFELEYWRQRGIRILPMDLRAYVAGLTHYLAAFPASSAGGQ